ncbi:hypothetical protein EDD85DRAFT_958759 [Armillaria nabsnona]|nr:hypothetical protein EDD85DRAFT_958759 [Armillaria nabsnona]
MAEVYGQHTGEVVDRTPNGGKETTGLKDDPPQPPTTSFRHPSSSAKPISLSPTALFAAWSQHRLSVWEFTFKSCPNEVNLTSARPTSIPSAAISADSIFELSSFTLSRDKWAMQNSGVENKGWGTYALSIFMCGAQSLILVEHVPIAFCFRAHTLTFGLAHVFDYYKAIVLRGQCLAASGALLYFWISMFTVE